MIITVYGVYLDGSTPAPGSQAVPYSQTVTLPQGSSGQVNLAVVNPAGTAVNISAGSIALTVKSRYSDASALVFKTATVDNGPLGLAHWPLSSADMALSASYYQYDVWWADGAGLRHQLVPLSLFQVTPAEGP